jgi:chloride channel protein, CIC family
VVAMGAVFASAARAPLTSLGSVVELTGDFTLTLPVMLAVAVATATSRMLSYGTLYTTKLLRRGQDIDRPVPIAVFGDLTAADVMRSYQPPLTVRWPEDQVLSGVAARVAGTAAHDHPTAPGGEGHHDHAAESA